MVVGLVGTFVHKIPGTPLIFLMAIIYTATMGSTTSKFTWVSLLFLLMVLAELGWPFMRNYVLPRAGIGEVFGLDVAAGSFSSLILTDVLAGPVLGLLLWEMLIGKSLMPLIKRSGILVVGLLVTALFRFSVAFAMMVIIVFKIM
jgi:uncharacterized protein YqgC (DUF456 family)